MQYAFTVFTVSLVHGISNSGFGVVPVSFLGLLVKVALHELKDEKELVILANNFFELHNIWMVQLLERLPCSHKHAVQNVRSNSHCQVRWKKKVKLKPCLHNPVHEP